MMPPGGPPLYAPEDFGPGKVAYFTPAPSCANRSLRMARPGPTERPAWAPPPLKTARRDLTAEKRLLRKSYKNLSDMLENPNGALRKNEEWFRGNKNGPLRKAVGELLGLGGATDGGVVQGDNQQGGVLLPALPHGPKSAPPESLALKGALPEDTGSGRSGFPQTAADHCWQGVIRSGRQEGSISSSTRYG